MNENIENSDLKIFAFIWAFLFMLIALYLNNQYFNTSVLFIFIAFLLILTGQYRSHLLRKPYVLWSYIGEIIGSIISKIVLFLLYFSLFSIVSVILKLLNKDPLNKKIDKSAKTYWIKRTEQPQSMKNQF